MLRLFSIFTIAALLYCVSADFSCRMPGYTTLDNKTCYKVYSVHRDETYDAAQCITDGGFLASVPNGFTNAYIQTLAKKIHEAEVWLGIQCPNKTKNYCLNDDGTQYGPYSNFYPGEPSFGTFIFMNVSNQQWYADHPGTGRAFVCEVKYEAGEYYKVISRKGDHNFPHYAKDARLYIVINLASLQCPQSYQLHENMCYRISNETKTRDDASVECKKVAGGFLATINSEELNEWVTWEQTQYSANVDLDMNFGLQCPDVTANGNRETCKWDDGTMFIFSAFHYYAPEASSNGGQPCVHFKQGDWFNYNPCTEKVPYICQAPALKS